MRVFRLLAIAVLLLACVVVGPACAGAKGEPGENGTDATDGVGIENVVSNADGTVTIGLSNGHNYTTISLTGPAGAQGIQGIQGPQGAKGDTGLPGTGIAWKGEWSNSTAYSQNDAVGYQGSSYISKQGSNTNHVPTDTVWWDLWVVRGDTGSQGIQGVQGGQGEKGDPGGLAWGTAVSHGPTSYNVGTGSWYESFDSLSPGDRVTFSVTTKPYVSAGVNFWVYDVYNNIILTGNGGSPTESGAGGFIAAVPGRHLLVFDVYGTYASIVTVSWTYYPHL
jgi:hypothetical protein